MLIKGIPIGHYLKQFLEYDRGAKWYEKKVVNIRVPQAWQLLQYKPMMVWATYGITKILLMSKM